MFILADLSISYVNVRNILVLIRIASKWLKIKLHTGAEIVSEQNRDEMLLAYMIATAVFKVAT